MAKQYQYSEGWKLFRGAEYAQALIYVESHLVDNPQCVDLRIMQAMIYLVCRKHEPYIQIVQILSADVSGDNRQYMYVAVMLQIADLLSRENAQEFIFPMYPHPEELSPDLCFLYGCLAEFVYDFNTSLSYYARCLKKNSTYIVAGIRVVKIHTIQKQYSQARAIAEDILEIVPDCSEALFLHALLCEKKSDTIKELKSCLKMYIHDVSPLSHTDILSALFDIYRSIGDITSFTAAIECCSVVLHTDPENINLRLSRAQFLCLCEDFDGAYKDIEYALQDPIYADIFFRIQRSSNADLIRYMLELTHPSRPFDFDLLVAWYKHSNKQIYTDVSPFKVHCFCN